MLIDRTCTLWDKFQRVDKVKTHKAKPLNRPEAYIADIN